jgi:4-alpha-glucanotransferase
MAKDPYGIVERYHDARGVEHETTDETRAAILAAMGVDPLAPPFAEEATEEVTEGATEQARKGARTEVPPVRVLDPGGSRDLPGGGDLVLEDGTARPLDGELPVDLPHGYHRLYPRSGGETLLIVGPGRCFLPDDLRAWGFAAQVYATRSSESWGMGDLLDLARLGRFTKSLGGQVVMVNPITAVAPVLPIEPSPYYPSSRRFRNPLFLRIEAVPGWDGLTPATRERLTNAGRALNGERRIDRNAIWKLKMEALEAIYARFSGEPGFDWYRAGEGQSLVDFATYCALAERLGKDWRTWPAGLRRPDGDAIARFRAENDRRVTFHLWLQWLLDRQLAAASREISVVHDLPIGLDVAGADAWCWQDLMARDVSVGAPPDEFNANGQDWGLTPFIPFRLRAARYAPIVETVRAMLRHAGGLRIDHVMGLFRLFWIPRALGAKKGTYVRFDADELMSIIALESERAKGFIVGEDLGTVEPGARERLAERRMLSYRLLYFEPGAPRDFPELALSSVTTHDLPTIAGLWTGADAEAQKKIGLDPNEASMAGLRARIQGVAKVEKDAPVDAVIEGTYRGLAEAPSRILLATVEDAAAVPERPNLPGTIDQHPNWSIALPAPLEELERRELPVRIARALGRPRANQD